MLLRAVDDVRGQVYDLDTNRRVPKVIELNLDTGYLKAYFVVKQYDDKPEQEVIRVNRFKEPEWYEAHGRFKFVPNNSPAIPATRIVMGAPHCASCSSLLTLPGDDLCPLCRAQDRRQHNRFVVERLTTPLLDKKCLTCSRLATWSVADEVDVTPETKYRYLWERGMTVGRRYYCNRCYRPARLLDARGEVIKDLNYAGPDVLQSIGNTAEG